MYVCTNPFYSYDEGHSLSRWSGLITNIIIPGPCATLRGSCDVNSEQEIFWARKVATSTPKRYLFMATMRSMWVSLPTPTEDWRRHWRRSNGSDFSHCVVDVKGHWFKSELEACTSFGPASWFQYLCLRIMYLGSWINMLIFGRGRKKKKTQRSTYPILL